MTEKRPRGRPKGTTLNDSPYLDAVADLLVRNPRMKKTPAISQIVQKRFPEHKWNAAERRLLDKWNVSAEERLQAAEEKLAEERIENRRTKANFSSKPIHLPTKAHVDALSTIRSFDRSLFSNAIKVTNRLDLSEIFEATEKMRDFKKLHDSLDPHGIQKTLKRIREITDPLGFRHR